MRTKLLLAPIAILGLSVAAQAADLTYNVTAGTFSPSGSFTGSFQINSSTEYIDGGTFYASAGGSNYTFVPPVSGTTVPGLALFTDAAGDVFRLALNGTLSTLAFNTTGTSFDTALILKGGTQYNATGGTITPAPTPEPSSLLLLGTGALGVAGAVRRRLTA